MEIKYKKVRKMYFTCDDCGESNEKVKVYNDDNVILCKKCYAKFKEEKESREEMIKDFKSIYDENGKVVCNICGKSFNNLGNHVLPSHGINIKQYKEMYNYDKNVSLISKDYYEKCMHRMDNFNNKRKTKLEKEDNKQLKIKI